MRSHFENLRYCFIYCAIWPEYPKNWFFRKFYDVIGYIAQVAVLWFVSTVVGRMVETIVLRDWTSFPGALNVAMLYSNIFIRVSIYKLKNGRKLLLTLIENEKLLYTIKNQEIRKIFKSSAWSSNSYHYVLMCILSLVIFNFGRGYDVIMLAGASEGTKFALPFDAYVPWAARTEYYLFVITTVVHLLTGTELSAYFIGAQLYFINIFTYISAELKVLQYYIKNGKKIVNDNKQIESEEVFDVYFSRWIARHKFIIQFVDDFNKYYRLVVLMDCSTLSLQLANIIVYLIEEKDMIRWVFGCATLLAVSWQTFLIYSKADEITVQSTNLAQAIYESKWEDMTEKIKHKMHVAMMRCQKPLNIYVGPFAPMSRELMMKIFRGVYTILACFYNASRR